MNIMPGLVLTLAITDNHGTETHSFSYRLLSTICLLCKTNNKRDPEAIRWNMWRPEISLKWRCCINESLSDILLDLSPAIYVAIKGWEMTDEAVLTPLNISFVESQSGGVIVWTRRSWWGWEMWEEVPHCGLYRLILSLYPRKLIPST